MKKLVLLLMSALLALSFLSVTGCQKKEQPAETSAPAANAPAANTPASATNAPAANAPAAQ